MKLPLKAILIILVAAGILWAGTETLSTYFASDAEKQQALLPEHLQELQKKVNDDPSDAEAHLAFARALVQEAYEQQNANMLMSAIQTYQQVLAQEPGNTDALQEIARVCLDQGLLDKAVEYYLRYLKEKPGDNKAKTDLALALLQMEKFDASIATLNEVIQQTPNYFPAELSLALAQAMKGDLPAAKKQLKHIQKFSPDEEAQKRIDQIKNLVAEREKEAASPEEEAPPQPPAPE